MRDTHEIALNEPWRRARQAGTVRYERWFHCPTGLSGERVWLVLENAPAAAAVTVNGRLLGAGDCPGGFVEFEITALLAPRNRIEIKVDLGTAAAAQRPATEILGRVKLEIRSRYH